MSEIKKLTNEILKFRKDRDWEQFHTPKDLAISLSLEANEVLEHFQWKSPKEIEKYIKSNREDIADEMGDVFNYLLLMAHDFNIDLVKAATDKIEKSALKYPIEKAKGTYTKYNKL